VPGPKITLKFKGTTARLYDIMTEDSGQAVVTVDGKTSPPRSTFDSYCWFSRLGVLGIADGLADEVHTVTVELHPDPPDRTPAIRNDRPDYDPRKYEGVALRLGGILMRGGLVKE